MIRSLKILLLATCALGGLAAIAQAEPDPLVDHEVEACFKAGDINKDGKISWQECLDREREFNMALDKARTEAEREKVFSRYEPVLDRVEFLLADADDDLVLTPAEYKKYLQQAPIAMPGQAPDEIPEQRLGKKDIHTLATANVDEQWASLLKDADKNKDKKLSLNEIRDHFLLGEFGVKNAGPDFEDEAVVGEDDSDTVDSFASADKNRDGALDKAEYTEFVALEYEADRTEFMDYLVTSGREPDQTADRRTTPAAKIEIKVGTTLFYRERERDPRTRAFTGEWRYSLLTVEKISALGVQGKSVTTDKDKKVLRGSGKGVFSWSWGKGVKSDLKVVKLTVGKAEYDCTFAEATFPKTVNNGDKEAEVSVITRKEWHLWGYPGILAKEEENGEILRELLEINLK